MKKNTLAVVVLALLFVALIAGCTRAKPAVVSDVQVTTTAAATVAAGRTVVPVASPSPTSEGTPETTPTPSPEVATPIPTTAAETTPPVAPTSTPVPTTVPTPVPTEAVSGERTHVVQPGENLFRIALHYGMTYTALAAANGIINPDLIYVGQRLTIPTEGTAPTAPTGTHVVQPGENLFRIALKYGVTVEALAVANGISNVNLIYPGQKLRIP
ncbi:MAG: LysM peptidoglycan-binding domain-containing protein [Anaerolineales bacterium]|nr:LysM peptidoglycan-binding domain-containing protein [Anaerolineales bacterium]